MAYYIFTLGDIYIEAQFISFLTNGSAYKRTVDKNYLSHYIL
jgi:hypothetical protein